MGKAAFLKELMGAIAERAAGEAAPAAPSRVGMDFKDVTKRIPELTEAANRVKAGAMGRAEYAELVQRLKPVEPYTSVPTPATLEEIYNAVTANKRDKVGKIGDYEEGRPVSLRLDIPAYKDHGVWAPTIHDLTDNFKSIAHEPAAHISGGRFDIPQKKSLNVAAGAPKSPFASIDGKLRKTPPEDIKRMADEALNSGEWAQVGMDPERHGYFYDRRTMQPIVEAEEVIQVGPLVLARKPKYGNPDDYMYAEGGPVRGYNKGGIIKKLMRLYHGTNKTDPARIGKGLEGFDHLSPDINPDQLGLHMGPSIQANSFAGRTPEITDEDIALNPHYYWSKGSLEDARVVPLDVDVQNPIRLQDRTGHWQPTEIWRQLRDLGVIPDDTTVYSELNSLWKSYDQKKRNEAMNRVRKMIEDAGHDGVVYTNRVEGVPSGMVYSRTKGRDTEQMTDEEFLQAVPEAQDSYIVWNKDKYRSPFGEGTGAGFAEGGEVDGVDAYFKRIYG